MNFYEIKNLSETSAELFIYGDIVSNKWYDDDVVAGAFVKDLSDLKDISEINVRINSYGGEVAAGMAIYNALKRHSEKINVSIDGFALSSASVIAMAGDRITMPSNSLIMIHNPSTFGFGEVKDFEKIINMLKKTTDAIKDVYVEKTGLSDKEILNLMNEETWLSADEALEKGFITNISEETVSISAHKDGIKVSGGVYKSKSLMNKIKDMPDNKVETPLKDKVLNALCELLNITNKKGDEKEMDKENLKTKEEEITLESKTLNSDEVTAEIAEKIKNAVSLERERIKDSINSIKDKDELIAFVNSGVPFNEWLEDEKSEEIKKRSEYLKNLKKDSEAVNKIPPAPLENETDDLVTKQKNDAEKIASAANKNNKRRN